MSAATTQLTGIRKAAILLVVLGDEIASLVYKKLPDADLKLITQEITDLEYISPQTAAAVLGYNYPGSAWYQDAYDLLTQEARVAPKENEESWISRAYHSVF